MSIRVKATSRWNPEILVSPFGGIVRPLLGETILLSEPKAKWAIARGYAVAADEETSELLSSGLPSDALSTSTGGESRRAETINPSPSTPTPPKTKVETQEEKFASRQKQSIQTGEETAPDPTEENLPKETENTPSSQERLVDFLNSASKAEEINEAIVGVGTTTSQKIIEAQPVTWEKIEDILSPKQLQSALSKFE